MNLFVAVLALAGLNVALGQDKELPTVKIDILKPAPEDCSHKAGAGDFLSVHYVGTLNDAKGDKFDSSRDRGQPFKFQFGAGQVITGYEHGTVGMCEGEMRGLTIPPHLAYGDKGIGSIPPESTLYFEIELVKLEKGKLKTLHPGLKIEL